VWCVIPVAGGGTRLRQLTDGRPKALVEVGGKSLIRHLLERLDPPFSDVCLVAGPDSIESFRTLGHRHDDLRLHYAEQSEPEGVADAVGKAAGLVTGPFVALMGDCYFEKPLSSFPTRWLRSAHDGAVLVEMPDDGRGQPMGLVRVLDRRVTEIFKAPWAGETEWRVCGAYLFPESFFAALDETPRADTGEYELEDVVTRMMAAGTTFGAIPYHGWRRNINTPDDLAAVEIRLAGGQDASP